jgi:Lantibiotic dehydratase, N terminus
MSASPAGQRPVLAGRWRLWSDVLVRSAGFPAAAVELLASPRAARAADVALSTGGEDAFRSVFDEESAATTARLRAVAGSTRFQEAVIWQNRGAWRWAVAPTAAAADGAERNVRLRKKESLVASYWQRYCVKNDTVGFFGPYGWARFSATAGGVMLPAGQRPVNTCEVYFEHWAIAALAEACASDARVRPWLRPRRHPYVRVSLDGMLHRPGRPPVHVGSAEAELLRRCDGSSTAVELCQWALDHGVAAGGPAVYELLAGYERRRLLSWTIDVPVSPHPERSLRCALLAIEDGALRRELMERLDRLERCRSAVRARAGGPAEALDAALDGLDATFAELTGRAAVRHPGRTYAGRTLVFLDCRREPAAALGPAFLDAVRPVALLLTACRWLTHRTAAEAHQRLVPLYERLRAAAPDGHVDLASLWSESLAVLHEHGPAIAAANADELTRRWARVLRMPDGARRVRRRADELGAAVAKEFGSRWAGWTGARHHSFDVMISAPDRESAAGGELDAVLGEIHVALNGLRSAAAVAQHPRPDDLLRCLDGDMPGRRLLPVPPRLSGGRVATRIHPALVRPRDLHVALLHDTVDRARFPVVCAADCPVDLEAGHLVVRVDGESFEVLDALSGALLDLVIDGMRIVDGRPHAPRITIDRLVVNRESWWFEAAALGFAERRDEAARFLEARRFWSDVGLPRHTFVKSPLEPKPVYVDWESPVLVDILARLVRRLEDAGTPGLRVTEMLPDAGHAWLPGEDGQACTSELRVVAFDLAEAGRWS